MPVFTKSKVWVAISFGTFILFLEKSKERLSDSPEVSGARNEEGVTCFISVSRRPGFNREEKWDCGSPRVLFFCPPETPEGNGYLVPNTEVEAPLSSSHWILKHCFVAGGSSPSCYEASRAQRGRPAKEGVIPGHPIPSCASSAYSPFVTGAAARSPLLSWVGLAPSRLEPWYVLVLASAGLPVQVANSCRCPLKCPPGEAPLTSAEVTSFPVLILWGYGTNRPQT